MVHTDLNCMSVIQFAVDVLKVEHILVVGHYGCGGVDAALNGLRIGLSDNWIRHVGDVAQKHATLLGGFPAEQRANRLCEQMEEHTSELQSLMRISYAVFCLTHNKNDHILN